MSESHYFSDDNSRQSSFKRDIGDDVSANSRNKHKVSQSVPSRERCSKKGDTMVCSDGLRRRFNGTRWRRLCSFGLCAVESHCSEGFCNRHKALVERKDEIMQQVGVMDDSGIPSYPSAAEALDDTVLFDISDFSQASLAEKGQIIPMRGGRFKKFNGKCWRWLCSCDQCWKEAQHNGLCHNHWKEKKKLEEES